MRRGKNLTSCLSAVLKSQIPSKAGIVRLARGEAVVGRSGTVLLILLTVRSSRNYHCVMLYSSTLYCCEVGYR